VLSKVTLFSQALWCHCASVPLFRPPARGGEEGKFWRGAWSGDIRCY